jgi:hypothetical protein
MHPSVVSTVAPDSAVNGRLKKTKSDVRVTGAAAALRAAAEASEDVPTDRNSESVFDRLGLYIQCFHGRIKRFQRSQSRRNRPLNGTCNYPEHGRTRYNTKQLRKWRSNMLVREKQERFTFSTGGLPGGDVEHLGGHPDGALHPKALVLGSLNQIGANCRDTDQA